MKGLLVSLTFGLFSYFYGENLSLHRVAKKGDIKKLKWLIKDGANVNAINKYGQTPLYFASFNGNAQVLKELIKNGAKVNTRDKIFGWTPLHGAAHNGHTQVIKELIKNGANVNARDTDDGDTPLHAVAIMGHTQVVRVLIKYGANIYIKNKYDFMPLDYAKAKGHKEIIKLLKNKL